MYNLDNKINFFCFGEIERFNEKKLYYVFQSLLILLEIFLLKSNFVNFHYFKILLVKSLRDTHTHIFTP